VLRTARILALPIDDRGRPRDRKRARAARREFANRLLRRVRDFAQVKATAA